MGKRGPYKEQDGHGLTETDYRIIGMICQGLTTKEMINDLKHTRGTIETYRARIVKRFRCRTSSQLIYKLFILGIIHPGCICTQDEKIGETSVMCCNKCGLSTETFWINNPFQK